MDEGPCWGRELVFCLAWGLHLLGGGPSRAGGDDGHVNLPQAAIPPYPAADIPIAPSSAAQG